MLENTHSHVYEAQAFKSAVLDVTYWKPLFFLFSYEYSRKTLRRLQQKLLLLSGNVREGNTIVWREFTLDVPNGTKYLFG